MAQLIPGIGAAVGVIVNYRLLNQLGKTAMNAYRMRWFEERTLQATQQRQQLPSAAHNQKVYN